MKNLFGFILIICLFLLIPGCGSETSSERIIDSVKAESTPVTEAQTGEPNSRSGRWDLLAPMSFGRASPGVIVYNEKIYIFGGAISRDEETNTVEMYDPQSNKWELKKSMPTAACFGAVLIDDLIYVIGDSVKIYDPGTDNWAEKKHNIKLTNNSGVAAVNGKIYVVGGNDDNAYKVFEYNPKTDEWLEKSRMKTSKRCYGIVSVGNLIYAVGGNDPQGEKSMAYVEAYDPENDKWTYITDMASARGDIAAAEINGKIFVTGGYINGPTNLVEEYDISTKIWTEKTGMNFIRSFHKAVCLNEKVYVIGGTDLMSPPYNSAEVYVP